MSPPIDIVAGRYRLLTLLGQGGMGSVWRGEHVSLQTPVAIKLLDPRLAQKEAVRGRFLREARSAAALQSQHVVQILDHGVEGDYPYIVMELLRGESLGARLVREPRMSLAEIARIFVQIGRAVARAHKAGVIHRDLKPDNVFLAEVAEETLLGGSTGLGYVVKVVDFGIAKITEQSELGDDVSTDTGTMVGTPHYMSPEQARSVKALDARSDLWSMGVIAFECVTGQRPFRGDSLGDLIYRICAEVPPVPSSIGPVPEGFDAWFARATQRRPEDRFQTVLDLVQALEDVLTPGRHEPDSATAPIAPAAPAASPLELDPTLPGDAAIGTSPPMREADAPPGAIAHGTGAPATRSVRPEPAARRPLLAAGALAVVALAIGVALSQRSPTPADGASAAPSPGSTSAPTQRTTSDAPTPPGERGDPPSVVPATAPTSPEPTAVAEPQPSLARAPDSARRVPASTARDTPPAPSSASRARAGAKPGCEEPFTVNAAGDLVPKPECF